MSKDKVRAGDKVRIIPTGEIGEVEMIANGTCLVRNAQGRSYLPVEMVRKADAIEQLADIVSEDG